MFVSSVSCLYHSPSANESSNQYNDWQSYPLYNHVSSDWFCSWQDSVSISYPVMHRRSNCLRRLFAFIQLNVYSRWKINEFTETCYAFWRLRLSLNSNIDKLHSSQLLILHKFVNVKSIRPIYKNDEILGKYYIRH